MKIYGQADELIAENGIDSISMAIRLLEKIESIDKKYEQVSNNLKSTYYELQEISRDISDYKQEIYFDEEERDFIEERLDLMNSLKRKYGNTIEEILSYKEEIEEEIKKIENLEKYNNNLKQQKQKIENEMNILAEKMHNIRVNKSKELMNNISNELEELEEKRKIMQNSEKINENLRTS